MNFEIFVIEEAAKDILSCNANFHWNKSLALLLLHNPWLLWHIRPNFIFTTKTVIDSRWINQYFIVLIYLYYGLNIILSVRLSINVSLFEVTSCIFNFLLQLKAKSFSSTARALGDLHGSNHYLFRGVILSDNCEWDQLILPSKPLLKSILPLQRVNWKNTILILLNVVDFILKSHSSHPLRSDKTDDLYRLSNLQFISSTLTDLWYEISSKFLRV